MCIIAECEYSCHTHGAGRLFVSSFIIDGHKIGLYLSGAEYTRSTAVVWPHSDIFDVFWCYWGTHASVFVAVMCIVLIFKSELTDSYGGAVSDEVVF